MEWEMIFLWELDTLPLLVFGKLEKSQNEYDEFWKQSLWSMIISERLLSVYYLHSNVVFNCCIEFILVTFNGTLIQFLLEPSMHTYISCILA